MTPTRQMLFDSMNQCVRMGRKHQKTDVERAMKELAKLAVLSDTLKMVTEFENKLVGDMDID